MVFDGTVTRGFAFVPRVADELPAVGPVAMQRDEDGNGGGWLETLWLEGHITLGAGIEIGGEDDVMRGGGSGLAGGQAQGDQELQHKGGHSILSGSAVGETFALKTFWQPVANQAEIEETDGRP